MTYDPFTRGRYPVGVRTERWVDEDRDRPLTVEIWYPATDKYRGHDQDAETWDTFVPIWAAGSSEHPDVLAHQEAVRDADTCTGESPWPLVLLIHGWAGYRQEATFIGTHLASHGYVVVAPDVPGSTWTDVDAFLTRCEPSAAPETLLEHTVGIAAARVGDIPFLITAAVSQLPVRPTRAGVTGASFGGYSSVIAPSADERVAAVAAMCPANDDAPIVAPQRPFESFMSGPWKTDASAIILAADRDSLLPLYGQLRLLNALPCSDKRLVTLARTDHNHFVDDIETGQAWLGEFAARVARLFPDGPGDWSLVARSVLPIERLLPAEAAKTAWRGILTAHFDAHLRDNLDAELHLAELDTVLADMGVETTVVSAKPSSGAHE